MDLTHRRWQLQGETAGGQLQGVKLQGVRVGSCKVRRLLNKREAIGYSAAAVVSPTFFAYSYPQALSTGRAGLGISGQTTERTPPVAELCGREVYTPQQKIFAKVKAAIWPLTCGYSTVM